MKDYHSKKKFYHHFPSFLSPFSVFKYKTVSPFLGKKKSRSYNNKEQLFSLFLLCRKKLRDQLYIVFIFRNLPANLLNPILQIFVGKTNTVKKYSSYFRNLFFLVIRTKYEIVCQRNRMCIYAFR